MKSVKVTIESPDAASRKELIIRFFYGLVASIIIGIIGIFAGLAWIVQWLHILFTAKRHKSLTGFINSYQIAYTNLEFYMMLSTDERPPLVPSF